MAKTTILLKRPATDKDIKAAREALAFMRPSSTLVISNDRTRITIKHEKAAIPTT